MGQGGPGWRGAQCADARHSVDAGLGPLLLLPQRPDPLPDPEHAPSGDHLLPQSLRTGLHAALALSLRRGRAEDGTAEALFLAHRRRLELDDDVLLGARPAAALAGR